jgi:hypothetical protein
LNCLHDGKDWTTPFSRSLFVLEPIDQFIKDLLNIGAATPLSGLADKNGQRYRTQRCFGIGEIRLPREVAEILLPDFDRLLLGLDRGEHPDLKAKLDEMDRAAIEETRQPEHCTPTDMRDQTPSGGRGGIEPDGPTTCATVEQVKRQGPRDAADACTDIVPMTDQGKRKSDPRHSPELQAVADGIAAKYPGKSKRFIAYEVWKGLPENDRPDADTIERRIKKPR